MTVQDNFCMSLAISTWFPKSVWSMCLVHEKNTFFTFHSYPHHENVERTLATKPCKVLFFYSTMYSLRFCIAITKLSTHSKVYSIVILELQVIEICEHLWTAYFSQTSSGDGL